MRVNDKMKRSMSTVVVLGFLLSIFMLGVVFADSNRYSNYYAEQDWFSLQSANEAIIPGGLSAREEEIYRAAYANGFYDALHPAYIEGRYMLNTKTKKFHLTNCPTTLLIDSDNRAYSTSTPEKLMVDGYSPCGQCHPETQTTRQNSK